MERKEWTWSKCFGDQYHHSQDFSWTTARESERKSDNLDVTGARDRVYVPVIGGGFLLEGTSRRGREKGGRRVCW